MAREYAAAAGYRAAGGALFERLAANCEAHVRALNSQLDSVGRLPPEPAARRPTCGDGVPWSARSSRPTAVRWAICTTRRPSGRRRTIMGGHAQHLVVLLENPLRSLGERS